MTDNAPPPPANVYVGPAGWSYPDWNGIVYPPRGRGFDALQYLSAFFDLLEVNTSFYRTPSPIMTQRWVQRIAERPRFRFSVKLQQRFTHQRDTVFTPNEVADFRQAVEPVAQQGRLGALLMQFPWSFRFDPAARDWLARLAESFDGLPLVVEVRHASWDDQAAREFLGGLGVSLCSIDQPRLRQCLPPAGHLTGPLGYVRLHGRRTDTWFAQNVASHERYNYFYSDAELREWIPRIEALAGQADAVYVVTNNHFEGQGPANAAQLRAMIERRRVPVPPLLERRFPELAAIALRSPPPGAGPPGDAGQATLFDDT